MASSDSAQKTTTVRSISNELSYDSSKVLGRGGDGRVVYNGTYKGKDVAVKRIQLETLPGKDEDREEKQLDLDHDNVLKILGVVCNEDFRHVIIAFGLQTVDAILLTKRDEFC